MENIIESFCHEATEIESFTSYNKCYVIKNV